VRGAVRFAAGGFEPERRSVTDEGEAWCRWTKREPYAGWYAQGRIDPKADPPDKRFWSRVLQLCVAAHGSRIDQVHSVGPGIFYLGAIGLTLASGDAALLLHRCMMAAPDRYCSALADAMATSFVYPVGRVMHETGARRLLSESRLRDVFTLGSNGKSWTMNAKERARTWCSCFSDLLSQMPLAQAVTIAEILPEEVPPDTKALLRLPHTMESLWNYEPDLQILWKLTLALVSVDAPGAAHLLATCTKGSPGGTIASMIAAAPSLSTLRGPLDAVLTELRRLELPREH
jgi:hypothetical protein